MVLKQALRWAIGGMAVLALACGREQAAKTEAPAGETAAKAPKAAPAAQAPKPEKQTGPVRFADGFSVQERGPDGNSWRWMSASGVVRLQNHKSDMVLKVVGNLPVEYFKQPPVLTLSFNGEQLDRFSVATGQLDKEYAIAAAKQASGEWSELRITSDQTFVPKNMIKGSPDERQLGVAITQIGWEEKKAGK